jgi:transcriptional regulator with XRE-family HTH domain
MTEKPMDAVPEWDVADRMRKAMRSAGIGVQEIADYLGVARNTVSTWINGRIAPSRQTLRLWALRCGVSYDWLKDGETIMPVPGVGSRNLRFSTPARRAA